MPTLPWSFARPMRLSCAAVFACALSVGVVGAQPAATSGEQSELIPRDLVLALLQFGPGSGGGTDLRVGKAPDDIPPELVPPGSQLLGSMTQFENIVIVLGVPEPPDSAVVAMESRLVTAGWTRPAQPASRPPMARGFVSADFGSVNMGGMPNFVCRGDESVTLSAMYRRSGGSLLKVAFNRSARYSMCRQTRDETVFRSPYDEAPIPVLRAPVGAMMGGGSGMSSSGNGGVTMHARVSVRLKPSELVAHYDAQMKEAGWTPLGDGAVDFLAARRYQKKDERNRTWWGTLYAIKAPEGIDHDVALQLARR